MIALRNQLNNITHCEWANNRKFTLTEELKNRSKCEKAEMIGKIAEELNDSFFYFRQ